MPWVRAKLRGQLVFARATEQGQLLSNGGRVEIRYKQNDGKLYRAAAANLEVASPEVLPDEACGEAEEVERGKKKRAASAATAAASSIAPPPGSVVAYTDGACSGNPGPAGLGLVVLNGEQRVERFEYLGKATNNIAELTAILRALDEIAPDVPAVIHTDSQYAIGVLQKGWKAKANKELIAELRGALSGRPVRLVYVPGHAGVPLNERADALARRAIEERGDGRAVGPEPTS